MLGAALVGAFAVARVATGTTTAALVTAAVGTLVVAVLRHHLTAAIVIGTAAVALCSLWWEVGEATRFGLPTPTTLHSLRHVLQTSRPVLVAFHLPLVHTPGIVLLCALISGLLAVAARSAGTRYPALSLVPAAVLLMWSAVLLPTAGAAFGGLALGACGFLVLPTGWRTTGRTFLVVAGVSLGTAALAVAWTAATTGSGTVSPGGAVVPAVGPTALSLTTDLTGLQTRDATVVLFRATTPVPTYWQVTSLTTFADNRWIPDQATQAILDGSPPTASSVPSSGQQLFTAQVTLAAYSGRLLPVPPSTVTATGETAPVVTTSGVTATAAPAPGKTYAASAVVPKAVADGPTGTGTPAVDTALGSIPDSVRSLAVSVTGSQSTPLGRAEALTDFFRSGRFHYTVSPSVPPAGRDPLVSFLTTTRTGSCEQFAGAFAVLARAAGLATRVAIGFTPGRPVNGVTTVRGIDAHAWPQVVIGGRWVSFEPTPQLPSGELSPPGVLGPAALGTANPTGPPSVPHGSLPLPTVPATTVPAILGPPVHHAARGGMRSWWWWLLAVFVLLAAGGTMVRQRRRRSALERVCASWGAIDRALSRRRVGRPRSRTPTAHVRALSSLHAGEQAGAALQDMRTVANILESATYGSCELTPEEVGRATRAGRRARRAILRGDLIGVDRESDRTDGIGTDPRNPPDRRHDDDTFLISPSSPR
jgi:transglutaminase-like putative cysteine protease